MQNEHLYRIILASTSPRRREILTEMGLEFEVVSSDGDEESIKDLPIRKLVEGRAKVKANAQNILDAAGADGVIIAADTAVYMRGKLYLKPLTPERAVSMLKELSGRWHSVYTGVCVRRGERQWVFSVRSRVKFNRLTDSQIVDYVLTESPLDKAGAYGIQDGRIVQKYRGSYTNIVGLPKERLARALRQAGVNYETN